MDINDLLRVVDTEMAASLCLSKGGWEGWLQCELWRHLNITKGEAAEREVPFPQSRERCDLVTSHQGRWQWIEIKAFGIFREGDEDRFLDSIAADVMKLDKKPRDAVALCLVVVPRAIGDAFAQKLRQRGWLGFVRTDATYAATYHMEF